MMTTSFLAALFGSYTIVAGIAMLFNPPRLKSIMQDFLQSSALLFLSGVLAFMGGIAVVYFHNIWSADWRVVLTLLGWMAVIEGAILIIAPKPLIAFADRMIRNEKLIQVFGLIYLPLGVFFLYKAFG